MSLQQKKKKREDKGESSLEQIPSFILHFQKDRLMEALQLKENFHFLKEISILQYIFIFQFQ